MILKPTQSGTGRTECRMLEAHSTCTVEAADWPLGTLHLTQHSCAKEDSTISKEVNPEQS